MLIKTMPNRSIKPSGDIPGERGPRTTSMTMIESAAAKLSKGATKKEVVQFLEENYKMTTNRATEYYYAACHYLRPKDPEKYREALIQNNISRLEKIIDECMEGTGNEKQLKVAREAIAELNKMLGISGNNVTIRQNQEEKTQEIQINFN